MLREQGLGDVQGVGHVGHGRLLLLGILLFANFGNCLGSSLGRAGDVLLMVHGPAASVVADLSVGLHLDRELVGGGLELLGEGDGAGEVVLVLLEDVAVCLGVLAVGDGLADERGALKGVESEAEGHSTGLWVTGSVEVIAGIDLSGDDQRGTFGAGALDADGPLDGIGLHSGGQQKKDSQQPQQRRLQYGSVGSH